MNFRDHIEVAVQVVRYGEKPGDRSLSRFEGVRRQSFWNQLRYLEHQWSRELDRAETTRDVSLRSEITEEVLVTHFLVRMVSAVSDSLGDWERHSTRIAVHLGLREGVSGRVVEAELCSSAEKTRSSPGLPQERVQTAWPEEFNVIETRLTRLRHRLEYWGDFLISRRNDLDESLATLPRVAELRAEYGPCNDSAWPLLIAGICRVAPEREIADSVRKSVHRLLAGGALSLVSERLFLADGRVKPRLMRKFDAGAELGL